MVRRSALTIQFDRDSDGDMAVLALAGELDLLGADSLAAAMLKAAGRGSLGDASRIAIDLSQLEFCDLAGLRVLIQAYAAGAALMEPQPCVLRLFTSTNLGHVQWTTRLDDDPRTDRAVANPRAPR